jgi:DNA polymerase-4
VIVEPDEVQAFLDPLPVGRLWGVGKVTGQVFDRLGIRTIGELRQLPMQTLNQLFGSSGEHYWRLSHGLDDRQVVPDREAKSISHETTFAEDIADSDMLQAWLVELVEQVARRLRCHERKGRTVELKVRFADFHTITRSATLADPTNITLELMRAAAGLLRTKLPKDHLPVRLLGFGVKGFDDSGQSQRQLFGEPDRERQRQLDEVADQIAGKFGNSAIRRGGGQVKG